MSRPRIAFAGLVLAIGLGAGGSPGAAFSDKDIFGQWCGDRDNPTWVNYRFTREKLFVTVLPRKSVKVFNIVRYDFSGDDTVVVHYRGADTKSGGTPGDAITFNVVFGHFSSDNTIMNQEKSEAGDVYVFRRCKA